MNRRALFRTSEPQFKIIVLFLASRGAGFTTEELVDEIGMRRQTLYAACESLSVDPFNMLAKQILSHNKAVWYPSSALLLLADDYFPSMVDVRLVNNKKELTGPDVRLANNGESTELKNLIINNNDLNLRTESSLLGADVRLKRTTRKSRPEHPLNPNFDDCYKTCRLIGIGDPAAWQIADSQGPAGDWMTVELIKAHKRALRPGVDGTGMLITRLRGWQSLPDGAARPEPLRGQAVTDEVTKYFPSQAARDYDDEEM
jgi:hypothetical protein